MQELWRKTIELFRKNPILWLPVLCSDITVFWLTRVQNLATRKIAEWCITTSVQSVLGGTYTKSDLSQQAIRRAELLGAPLEWGTYFAHIGLYTAAFVMTAMLVNMLLQNREADSAEAFRSLRSFTRGMLRLSIKLLGIYAAGSVVFVLPITYLWKISGLSKLVTPSFLGAGEAVVISTCAAWLLTPTAIALLQAKDSISASADQLKWGRIFAILTPPVSILIGYLAQRAEQAVPLTSNFEFTVAGMAVSVASSVPYIVLFVSLSLVAASQIRDAGNPVA
jgi:hypothetical protein